MTKKRMLLGRLRESLERMSRELDRFEGKLMELETPEERGGGIGHGARDGQYVTPSLDDTAALMPLVRQHGATKLATLMGETTSTICNMACGSRMKHYTYDRLCAKLIGGEKAWTKRD